MSRQFFDDPELADLLAEDPGLREIGSLVRASARVEPPLDPRFQQQLRRDLMEAAQSQLGGRARRWWSLTAGRLALGGAAIGAALAAAAVIVTVSDHRGTTVETPEVALCSVCGQAGVPVSQAITVGFNVPMDHASVESGLTIQPAVAHTVQWNGNQLVIVPTHKLAANTSYIITIDHSVARDTSGTPLSTDVHLTFGTEPSPTPTAAPTPTAVPGPPSVQSVPAGTVEPHSPLFFGPDGNLYGSAPGAVAAQTASPAPTSTSSPSASSHGAPTGVTASPGATGVAGSPSASSAPAAPQVVITRLTGNGSPAPVASPALAGAISPDGSMIAFLQPGADGGTTLWLAQADGSGAHQVATVHGGNDALAWTADGSIHYVSDGHLWALDTSGKRHTLEGPGVSDGQVVVWSPDGHYAYIGWSQASGNATDGVVVTLSNGHTRSLQGSREHVAFSGDGSEVVWADFNDPTKTMLDISATTSLNWLYIDSGSIGDVAADANGGRVAYVRDGHDLRIVSGDGKQIIAELHGSNAISHPIWSPGGERVAFVDDTAGTARTATIPGANIQPAPTQTGAEDVLNAFTTAQLTHDATKLAQLAPGLDPTRLLPPSRANRRATVSTSQSNGTVIALVRLVQDATDDKPARYADETVTLKQESGSWLVTAVQLGDFKVVRGPQVTGVETVTVSGTTAISLTFDSDLDPQTVQGAVSVLSGGQQLDVTVSYNADTRTVTVVVPTPSSRTVQIVVATSLHDVSAMSPSQEFTTTITL